MYSVYTYADIPNNDFDRPTLDHLRICPEQVPHRDTDVLSNAGLFAHMTKYLIDKWMYSAY